MTKQPLQTIVIDDDVEVLDSLVQWLQLADMNVTAFTDAKAALASIAPDFPGVIVSDIRMPGMDGMALLQTVSANIPVILITGHGGIAQAVEAMKLGAFDFIEKPFKPERMVELIERAWQQRQVTLATQPRQIESTDEQQLADILIGNSSEMSALRKQVLSLAAVNADVIVHGETGTGKELIANSLHNFSARKDQPFVAVNVAAIPENLLESELFGHEAGAFTGANKKQQGIVESANHGTLFLDEIESMPLTFQIKLLRVLQEREVTPVGSRKAIPLNIRIISATKEDLRIACNEGRFREDLYYRLMVADLHLPPLRNRQSDVALLFNQFLKQSAQANQLPLPDLTYEDILALELYEWPGNVRELKHTAERYLLTSSFNNISVSELLQVGTEMHASEGSLNERMEQVEKALISAELQHHKGNIKAVMDVLDLPRRTLNQKMQKYDLKREHFV